MKYYSPLKGKKKGHSSVTCYNTDEPGGHYAEWNKETYTVWFHLYEIPRVFTIMETDILGKKCHSF